MNRKLLNDRVLNANLHSVTFSFDGASKESYEYVRAHSNFERTVDNIRTVVDFLSAKGTLFFVNSVTMKRNVHEIPAAVALWEDVGIDSVSFIPMVVRNAAVAEELLSSEADIARYRGYVEAAARRIIDNNFRITMGAVCNAELKDEGVFDSKYFAPNNDLRSSNPMARQREVPPNAMQRVPMPGKTFPCNSPYTFARINWAGELILCSDFVVGNIHDADILEIWNSELAQRLRARIAGSNRICNCCEFFKQCITMKPFDEKYDKDFKMSLGIYDRPAVIDTYDRYNICQWQDDFFAVDRDHMMDVRLVSAEDEGVIVSQDRGALISRLLEAELLAYSENLSEKDETTYWRALSYFLKQQKIDTALHLAKEAVSVFPNSEKCLFLFQKMAENVAKAKMRTPDA